MMKKINFYTSIDNPNQISDDDVSKLCLDISSTQKEIKKISQNGGIVHTTQLSLLKNCWDYIADGISIFVFVQDDIFKIEENIMIRLRENPLL